MSTSAEIAYSVWVEATDPGSAARPHRDARFVIGPGMAEDAVREAAVSEAEELARGILRFPGFRVVVRREVTEEVREFRGMRGRRGGE